MENKTNELNEEKKEIIINLNKIEEKIEKLKIQNIEDFEKLETNLTECELLLKNK